MTKFKLKTFAYSVSVIALIGLAACNKTGSEPEPPAATAPDAVPVAAAPPAAAAPQTQASATQSNSNLGLYSGKFNPTQAQAEAQIAYEAWALKHADELEYEFIVPDLKMIPAQLRPYMYQDPIYGNYSFISPNRLSIIIDEIAEDNTFRAHSVAAGNERQIIGTWQKIGDTLKLVGKEPGDQADDGSFDMVLDKDSLSGTWTAFRDKAIPKEFKLVKTEFEYDPSQNIHEMMDFGHAEFDKNPSLDTLKTADVENLTKQQISMIQNFIFARHGYSFNKKNMRIKFENLDWYIPVTNDIKANLTEVEKNNLSLLNRYQKYADSSYDYYGR
jgi:YARHG domain